MSKKINKRISAAVCSAILSAGIVYADYPVVYMSPNNDGVKDNLSIPLKIKEKRYIKEWSLNIFNEKGTLVRTIGNKVALPEDITVKGFFNALTTPKSGVEVPSNVIWNGIMEDGAVAPDGLYYYQFTASDDNGNTATTSKLKVIVDSTAPSVNLTEPSDKSFGEGAKGTFKIAQSGSKEELWTAKITDAQGKLIKTYRWEKEAPVTVEWNGTDDKGAIVPDGIYNYEITSTDLAGNVCEKAQVKNIIFSAEKPEIAVSVNGTRFFAPAPKGKVAVKNETVKFDVAIPSPTTSVNSLTNWSISVVAKDSDKVFYTTSGTKNPPANFVFNGKDNSGKLLAEGEYRTKITARYLNGYEPAAVYSPVFVLDNQAPAAKVSLPSNTVFNGKSNFEISQENVPEPSFTGEKTWTGTIVDSKNNVVRQFNFDSNLPPKASWNGLDDNGKFVADGSYRYVLNVTEPAGNSASFETASFVLDTSKTELALSVSPRAFSLASGSTQNKVVITSVAKASSGIESYVLSILDSSKNVVKKYEGHGAIPSSFTWDGKDKNGSAVKDGKYFASISTIAKSGTTETAASDTFIIDSVAPSVKISSDYTSFSPDGSSKKQVLPVKAADSTVETKWTAEVLDLKNNVVKTFTWNNAKIADFSWDGTDDNGNKAANGIYSIVVSAKDEAGNSTKQTLSGINLDTRAVSAFVTAQNMGISPNGDGRFDEQKFDVKVAVTDGIASWKFDIVDMSNKAVFTFTKDNFKSAAFPSIITWNGIGSDNKTCEGTFKGVLSIEYAKGNSIETSSGFFLCTTKAPDLSVKTSPKYFSPDNDGNDDELNISLRCKTLAGLKNWSFIVNDRNGNQFWKTSGKNAITERIVWDGRGNNGEVVQSAEDYPFVFTATDELGMTSVVEGLISVDVLVIRDGDKLKMQIPSIIFRSDAADFGVQVVDASGKVTKAGITKAQADNNERVLKRVAEILKKFSDYKVTVVGHANRTSDNDKEETEAGPWGMALTPLSKDRAEFVKSKLKKLGVSGSRLSTEGMGGTKPVANRKDKTVNWKNRRVEFILEK